MLNPHFFQEGTPVTVPQGRLERIPATERPRERCLKNGPQCLSLRECLALILNTGPKGSGCMGVALDILERPGSGLPSDLEDHAFFTAMEISPLSHLNEISGLGEAGRARMAAAFELGRRYSAFRETRRRGSNKKRTNLRELSAAALQRVSSEWRFESREWLGFIPYHRSGELGSLCVVERGSRTHVNVDPAELFARILALRPQGFFLAHNHPSGNLQPSLPDLELTRQVSWLSKKLGVRCLGHWIVAPESETWLEPPAI